MRSVETVNGYANNNKTASPFIKNNLIYEKTTGKVTIGILVSGDDSATVNPKIYHNTIDRVTQQGIATALKSEKNDGNCMKLGGETFR